MQRRSDECKKPVDLAKVREGMKALDGIVERFPDIVGESSRENEEGFYRDLEPYLEPETTQ